MPSLNEAGLTAFSYGGYASKEASWEGFTVAHETTAADVDARELFSKLPNGACMCPHWGYQISGEASYIFPDRVETYTAGDFFYLPPGHVPTQKAGSEWVTFSPVEAHAATQTVTRAHDPQGS